MDAEVTSDACGGMVSRNADPEPCPLQCSSTAGVSAPLSWLCPLCRGCGDDMGLSLDGEEEIGVKTLLGVDPRVAIWDGEDGGFVDRVK